MKLKWNREYDARGKLTSWIAQHGKYVILVYREFINGRASWTLAIDDSTKPHDEHAALFTGFEKAALAKDAAIEQVWYLREK